MFRGLTHMHETCPSCGLVFSREPGYFVGAMYFSYALSILVMAVVFGLGTILFPDWNSLSVALATFILYLPFVPIIFRYSRVIWVYFDRFAWPDETPKF